jgi:methylmalonyl-CoA mutase
MTDGVTKLAADFKPATAEVWRNLVVKALKGADFDKRLVARTSDGISIKPLYTRADEVPGVGSELPGAAPLTRGTRPAREGLGWDIRQFYSEPDPAALNGAILEDLDGGTNSVAIQLAAPGTSGMTISADMLAKALEGVLLDLCPVALIAGERFTDAANALFEVWQQRGIGEAERRGHLDADPFGALTYGGVLSASLDDAVSEAIRLIPKTAASPHVTALGIDAHAYHAAGASEAQELAVMLSTLVAYLKAAEAAGIPPEQAIPKITFTVAADADQFLGIAKLRAARNLIWRVAEAVGAGDAAKDVRITAVTAWRMLARRDPWTNMLRSTIACAGAALGGADAIVVLPHTFALGRTDRFARRMSRNIQIVLQEESNLGRVMDPAGGSWYVEKLTGDLAKTSWALFQAIEAKGGMAAALTSGFVQDEIAKTAEARAKAVATGRQALTGVSAFPLLGDDGVSVDPWPSGRPPAANPKTRIPPLKWARLAEPFEKLRDAADAHKARTGKYPQVFLASLGVIAEHTVRSTWTRNYLAAGGIEALSSDGYKDAAEAAAAFRESGASVACISSSDAVYAEQAEAAARALKSAGAKVVLMAGRPGENEAALKSAGVDQFVFAGADAVATLASLQKQLEVL